MKVIIVDDHPLVRQGLLSVLAMENDIEFIGEGSNIGEAIDMVRVLKPDLVLVDLRLGKECGLDIISVVKKEKCTSKFIVLTSSASYSDLMMAEECGVDGYVLKEALPEELIFAIRMVSRGRKYYDPVLLEYKLRNDEKNGIEQLTAREQEVLRELSRGFSNQRIADNLCISDHTVKKHIGQILAKLGLQDRTQAALYARSLEQGVSS